MGGDRNTSTTIQAFFEEDHREIDKLVVALVEDMKAATANPDSNVGSLVSQLEEIDRRLERHIDWEEDILFPAVEEVEPHLRDGPGHVMRVEHNEIRDLKESSLSHLRDGAVALALRDLEGAIDILEDHNQKEELIYYPTADQFLDGDAARQLLEQVRATP